jgi:hypothetical protein
MLLVMGEITQTADDIKKQLPACAKVCVEVTLAAGMCPTTGDECYCIMPALSDYMRCASKSCSSSELYSGSIIALRVLR